MTDLHLRANFLPGLSLCLVLGLLLNPLASAGDGARGDTGQDDGAQPESFLQLNLRTRVKTESGSDLYHAITEPVRWNARETAIVICDMWNDHYCQAAASRVAEMAPRMNSLIKAARDRGVLIIHSPSGCMDQYKDTPQRRLAQQAPKVETEIPLKGWCYLDPEHESDLPIEDDVPCDDENPRKRKRYYSRQIETIQIARQDAITDSAEAYYLMVERGISNVILMGVHTNKCVLGRPFGIRQLVYQGQNVVLMRDMTDSMYSPRQAPHVSHFTGDDLVIAHVEKHWCPTITSVDLVGGEEFRFQNDTRKHLVIIMAEDEYQTNETLPAFARKHLGSEFRVSLVHASTEDRNDLPGIQVLEDADLALLSVRRRTLPAGQMKVIHKFLEDGKPLVAIRTSSHAFCLRGDEKPEKGLQDWPQFDRQVLGGHYQGHHGNKLESAVQAAPEAKNHPILTGVGLEEFTVFSSLYKSLPLAKTATPLMLGRVKDMESSQPVAWTNTTRHGGRVFYTSLGHPRDFELPRFERLLLNGIYWVADLPVVAPD